VQKEKVAMTQFEHRLERLDLALFDHIHSQSSRDDKRSWLALQYATRARGTYTYLEIGSHLGGSIQPHLVDPMCRTIYSIDKRPESQPDDRGQPCRYEGNSTSRMIENLRAIDGEEVRKVITFDAGVEGVSRSAIQSPPDLCFIDGEHTRAAVVKDFNFCKSVAAASSIIYFHDAQVVYRGIADVLTMLRRQGVVHHPAMLGGATFAIAFGGAPQLNDPALRSLATTATEFLRLMRFRHARTQIGKYLPESARRTARNLLPARWMN
jgi:methyltransferase family protein